MDPQPHQFAYVRKRKTTIHDNPGEVEDQSSCISIGRKYLSLLDSLSHMLYPKAGASPLAVYVSLYLQNS